MTRLPPPPPGQAPNEPLRLMVPLTVLVTGVLLTGAGLALMYVLRTGYAWQPSAAVICTCTGAGLASVGLAVSLFRRATHQTVEWFLAWRYLRETQRRSRVMLVVGLSIGGVALLLWILSLILNLPALVGRVPGGSATIRGLQAATLICVMLSYLVSFMGILLLNFSLFTSISILGVFLGTAALVVVLSVMGGFEHDLRQKILGTTAHVTISRHKSAFTDYRSVVQKVSRLPDVRALMPLIESEVMVTSQTNLSGVLLKGIDPGAIGKVTDLPRYLEAGGSRGALSYLSHPEKLAKLPRHRYSPLVLEPGEDPASSAARSATKAKQELKREQKLRRELEQRLRKERKKLAQLKKQPGGGATSAGGSGSGTGSGTGSGGGDDGDEDGDEDDDRHEPRLVYPAIIIGAELAKNLRLAVGDDVNMVAPLGGMSPAGPIPKSKPFRVAGIFFSGMYEYDTKFAYVTIPAAQRFLGMDDVITGIEIKARQLERATPLAVSIRSLLGGAGQGYDVEDWKQRNSGLFSALKLERVVMFIVLTFIVLVASFCIITTLIMVVLEKKREIAALKAMGATNNTVLRVFLFAGLYIGTIGMLVGVLTGVGICLFLAYVGLPLDPEVYYISELPVKMNARDILIVAASAEALAFVATIYPSMLAANLKPVEGLRRYTG